MKNRDVILDFTSLLDITLIILFFFILYTAFNVEKAEQRALLQYFKPENHELIRQTLRKAGRPDLIGSGPHCLVPAGGSQNRKTGQKYQGQDGHSGKQRPQNSRRPNSGTAQTHHRSGQHPGGQNPSVSGSRRENTRLNKPRAGVKPKGKGKR